MAHLFLLLFLGGAALFRPFAAAFNYGSALSNSILFFEGQRSGFLPSSSRVQWRANSGLHDGAAQGVDLVGGYYDAGDNVKFGLPMAFTITMLSWSAVEYSANIASVGQMEYVLDAIKWGTDYFIKAHPEPNVLWGEVGDGDSDHYCWQRPEEMTTSREAYQINAAHPGSDLAGETAAAMAAASIVFRRTDEAYSNVLVGHAKQLFNFADTYRGKYDSSISVARAYYQSQSGYDDELLWAALWLFEATSDEYYLNYAIENANNLGGVTWAITEFSWDVKYAGLQVLAAKIMFQNRGGNAETLQEYRLQADSFMCSCLQKNYGNNVARTPGGLMYTRAWNNMQYVSSASFLLTVYSDYLSSANQQIRCPTGYVQPSELLAMAKSQVDYILGNNPRGTSYMVGFGENYPQRVHHRGASIVSFRVNPTFVACRAGYQTWYVRSSSDPNVHLGALVGGPDENDDYADSREDFEQSEPATYNNGPMVGVLARISGGAVYDQQLYPAVSEQRFGPSFSASKLLVTQVMTDSWSVEGQMFHRYEGTVKNNSPRTLRHVQLSVTDLYGPLWGLSQSEQGTYTFPEWLKSLPSAQSLEFYYIHPAPPAAIAVASANFG